MATPKQKTILLSAVFSSIAQFVNAEQQPGLHVLAEGDNVDLIGFASNSYLEFFGLLTDCENSSGQYNDDVLTSAKKCAPYIKQWRVIGFMSKNGSLQPIGLQFAVTVLDGKLGAGAKVELAANATSVNKVFSNLGELLNNMSNRHSMTYDSNGLKAIDAYHKSYGQQAKSLTAKQVTVDELPALVPLIQQFIALPNFELTNSTTARVYLHKPEDFTAIRAMVDGLDSTANAQRIAFAQLLVTQAVGDTTLSFKNFDAMLALPTAVFESLQFSVTLCWLLPESQAWQYEDLTQPVSTQTVTDETDANNQA